MEGHRARFTLRTCGAATLWVNGVLAADFVPYSRNKVQQIDVDIDVRPGINRFEIQFEDLAERDTEYYFRLDYLGEESPLIVLPTGDCEPNDLLDMEQSLEGAYFERETVMGGDVVLQVSNPLGKVIPVDVTWGNFFDGVHQKQMTLLAGSNHLALGHCDEIGMGYKYFTLDFWLDGLRLNRKVGLETHLTRYDLPDAEHTSVSERKAAALQCVAEQGSRNIHTAIAMLHAGGDVSEAERMIREGIARINAREDCSRLLLSRPVSVMERLSAYGQVRYSVLGCGAPLCCRLPILDRRARR